MNTTQRPGRLRLWLIGLAVLGAAWFATPAWAAGNQYAVGDTGPVVETIQTSLKNDGYFGGQVDGKFTQMTKQAVIGFQKAAGLRADGIVEAKTYKALTGQALPPRPATAQTAKTGSGGKPDKILDTALAYKGVKYRFGGSTPAGFDCSGFVMYVFDKNGVKLPRTADKQYEVGKQISSKRELKPGDLVFFETYEKGASHVGIYQGNGNFVHASTSRGVTVTPLTDSYFGPRYLGARRVL